MKLTYIVMLAITMAITALILVNSQMDYEASHKSSGVITEIIVPSQDANHDNIDLIIRKIAHLVEYALLGVAVMSLMLHLRKHCSKNLCGYGWFYVLAVAVIDEHIQSYSDRTSSTADILLDFCGALIGFFIVWLVSQIYITLRRKTKKN